MKRTQNQMKSRRHFLRGAGVALALPWMESLPLLAQARHAARRPLRASLRCASRRIYFSNGVEPIHWWAKGSGASMEIRPGARADDALSRRHRLRSRPVQPAGRCSPPVRTSAGCRTCCRAPRSALIRTTSACGTTCDQVLARQIGGQTAVPSLVLGIEPNELRLEDGLSMIYGSCISWATPTKPATKEIYPCASV